MDRQAAYVIVQRNAMRMYEEGVDLPARRCSADEDLLKMMTPRRSRTASRAGYHLKHVDDIFQRVFGRSE